VWKPSYPGVRAGLKLTLLVTASFVLGCDKHPSLGRYERAEVLIERSPAGGGGMNAAIADKIVDAGSASAPPTATAMTTAGGGKHDATIASIADAGVARPDAALGARPAPLDASTSSACREGTYLGNFTCTVDTLTALGAPSTATTQVALNLKRSSQSTLALAGSSLTFEFSGFMLAADLVGQLDCTTNVFHADIANGLYAATLVPIPVAFAGVIDGTLDRMTMSLSGSWSFGDGISNATCVGNWSAAFQP
jgi:hypothetical protein